MLMVFLQEVLDIIKLWIMGSYDPTHPDANENGYVELPNVDLVKEITDGMAAIQAFHTNVTARTTPHIRLQRSPALC